MRDKIVQRRVREARDRFIQSIDEDAILRLASAHHGGDACVFFKPPARGSYNVCYFVRFGGDGGAHGDGGTGDLWVVRIPLDPYLHIPAHEKVETEVAVMKLIASQTTIPIPKVHAYSAARDKGPFGVASYIILEYVRGTALLNVDLSRADEAQRHNLYRGIADVFIQLRRLEFPAIGRLAPSPYGGGVEVSRPPVSSGINMQAIEGLQPLGIMGEYCQDGGILTSANDYVSMLLRIGWDAYMSGKTKAWNEEEAGEDIFNLDMFATFVRDTWLDPALDKGPFVLDHGDLNAYNVFVDETTLEVLAILDWEWSRVVPRQFFVPPVWLSGRSFGLTAMLGYFYGEHVKMLDAFRTVVREREQQLSAGMQLSDEWADVHERAGILVPTALDNWTFIDTVAMRYIDPYLSGRAKDRPERIRALLAARPEYRADMEKKIKDTAAYCDQLRELGIEDSDSEDEETEKK